MMDGSPVASPVPDSRNPTFSDAFSRRNPAMDALKALLAVLVVAHHSFLAYTTSGYASMVVDGDRFQGFDYVTGYLDLWFMSLFFFVSGLFVWSSLDRKGVGRYALDRTLRLGVPYTVGLLVVVVPAYFVQYWAYLKQTADPSIRLGLLDYLRFWGATLGTKEGPLWFLWVLFAFSLLAALLHRVTPRLSERVVHSTSAFYRKPSVFFLVLIPVVLIPYLLLWTTVGNDFERIVGPFSLQISRLPVYLTFFSVGILFGIRRLPATWADPADRSSRLWWVYLLASVLLYAAYVLVFLVAISTEGAGGLLYLLPFLFAPICAFASMGVFGGFVRGKGTSTAFGRSLSDNAFGIYLLHYPLVAGLQFVLLDVRLAGLWKGLLVFSAALLISWAISALLRTMSSLFRKR